MKAVWNDQVIAESKDTLAFDGNHYFPADSLKREFVSDSELTTVCPWKGTASYYSLNVGGKENPDAVWYYPEPKEAAQKIKGRIAFWRGVEVLDS